MHRLIRFSLLVATVLLIAGGTPRPNTSGLTLIAYVTGQHHSQLQRIRASGTLRVVTRTDPTTYHEGPNGMTGLEHDLIKRFAKHLGVTPRFIVPDTFEQMIELIANGRADIAASGLTITQRRKDRLRFAPSYQTITEQIVYRAGTRRPRSMIDLVGGRLEVVKGTSHVETLRQWKTNIPALDWRASDTWNNDELLGRVASGEIDYTIADSNKMQLVKRFHPQLRVALDISNPRQLAWALTRSDDTSLYDETARFFRKIERDHTLAQLIDRHYGHANALDNFSNRSFRRHAARRLPLYRAHFQKAADTDGIDWRLLAAIGYQESHWRASAVSPTGVRGIMMLTGAAAKDLGIQDRTDPAQSIAGGSRYFTASMNRISDRIPQPDRTWMALAAYNVGFGHLQDARMLAKKHGANPDRWVDVKKYLPLLSKPRWYRQTKYGYARGSEPVRYVENIRYYYDLLVWLTETPNAQHHAANTSAAATVQRTTGSPAADTAAFTIDVLTRTLAL